MTRSLPTKSRRSTLAAAGGGLVAALCFAACGGDDGTDEPPPPPAGTAFVFALNAATPCDATVPRPTDLFRGDDLSSELTTCAPPSDPIEAALQAVTRDDGAALATPIIIGVSGGDLDAASVAARTSFSLTSTVGTSTAAAIPPVLLLRSDDGTSTVAADWTVVSATPLYAGGELLVTPNEPLDNGAFYALVATDSILSGGGVPVGAAPAMALITGAEAIAAGAIEGLDGPTAAKLERERQRLSVVIGLLATAKPPIAREHIKSIQGWHSALGPKRLERVLLAYRTAVGQGRFPYAVTRTVGNRSPDMVYAPGTPASFYENVDHFFQGTITVPNPLDDAGHFRDGWATSDAQTTEVPFLISIPKPTPMRYPVTLMLPGYGRSSLDVRALANAVGGGGRSAVMAIDLPFHGARTVDPATGAARTDDTESNGDPGQQGADGVPDASGQGYLTGAPRAARDRMLAMVLEVVHILETIKDTTAFRTHLISPEGRESQTHLIGQGHTAAVAIHAAAAVRIGTLQLPSGGVGIQNLLTDGPPALTDGFMATVPSGVTAANLSDYVARLEATVLSGVAMAESAEVVKERYVNAVGRPVRVLLPHGSQTQTGQHVPAAARQALVSMLSLPSSRVSEHKLPCDDFFVHTCRLGNDFARVLRARAQFSSFISSGGQTRLDPAP